MSENLVLLEVVGGVCGGPLHIPAPTRTANGRQQMLADRMEANAGIPPKSWDAECGAKGIIYVDAPLFADRPVCFGCRVRNARNPIDTWRRYDNDADRLEARRRTWRESKRRSRRVA